MKIIIDRDIPFIQGLFEPYAEVVYLAGRDIDSEAVADCDALIVRTRTRCDENLLKDSHVRFIATATIGTDHIDTAYCFKHGIIVANARQVLSSMAHCPMRLEKDKTVRMNPYGTYYGKQRNHWSRADGEVLDAYTLVAAQGKSIAPSYNGSSETALFGLYPMSSAGLSKAEKEEICAFADGALITAPDSAPLAPFTKDNISVREGKADGKSEADLKNPVMTGFNKNLGQYIRKGVRGIGHIVISQIKARK